MGVHQFKLSMVPKACFERAGRPVPPVLSEEDVDFGESMEDGWWSICQPSEEALNRLRNLCPVNTSWDETEEYESGNSLGSDLRIWWEKKQVWQVTFRYSPSVDPRELLDRFVAVARSENCLLLDGETGSLFEPEDEIVTEHLRRSLAMRFVCDPQGAIIEGAKRQSTI